MNSNKKVCGVLKSLPFDCWCEVIRFLATTKDFHSVILTVKGLLSYIERIAPLAPRCTENIVHLIREKPKKPVPHVTSLRYSPNPSFYEPEKRDIENDVFDLDVPEFREIEVCSNNNWCYSRFCQDMSSSSTSDVNIGTLISGFLSSDDFPNLFRLEIEVLGKKYYDLLDNEEEREVNPFKNMKIENVICPNSKLLNLKFLHISLTCMKLSIKQILGSVEVVRIIRLGNVWDEEINDGHSFEYDSFFEKYELDVDWKTIFPRLHSLFLLGWKVNASQFHPISNQLRNLWLDRVDLEGFDLSQLKCKSLKLSGEICPLFRDVCKLDVDELIFCHLSFNVEILLTSYSDHKLIVDDYFEEIKDHPFETHFSTLKDMSNLRIFRILDAQSSTYKISGDVMVLRDLPKLEHVQVEYARCHIEILDIPSLQTFIYKFRDTSLLDEEDEDYEKRYSLRMLGDFPNLKEFNAPNLFLKNSVIKLLTERVKSIVCLLFGFDWNMQRFQNENEFLFPKRNKNPKSKKLKPMKFSIVGFDVLETLWIGNLNRDQRLVSVASCPRLLEMKILVELELSFRIYDLPSLTHISFGDCSLFELFVEEDVSKKSNLVKGCEELMKAEVEDFLSDLENLNGLKCLELPFSPFGYSSFSNLTEFRICHCYTLSFSGESVFIGGALEMRKTSSLETVRVVGGKREVHVSNISSLKEISVSGAKNLSIRDCSNLEFLSVYEFAHPISISDISKLTNLKTVELTAVPRATFERLNFLESLKWANGRKGRSHGDWYIDLVIRSCRNLKEISIKYRNSRKREDCYDEFRDSRVIIQDCVQCTKLELSLWMKEGDKILVENTPITTLETRSYPHFEKEVEKFVYEKLSIRGNNFPDLQKIVIVNHDNSLSGDWSSGVRELIDLKNLNEIVLKNFKFSNTIGRFRFALKIGGLDVNQVKVVFEKKEEVSLKSYLSNLLKEGGEKKEEV